MPRQKVERIQNKRFSALGLLRKNALLQNYDCTFGQYFGLYDGERVLTSWRNSASAQREVQQERASTSRRYEFHARYMERYVRCRTADPGKNPAANIRVHIPDRWIAAFREARAGAVEPV
jgi:hypothetical protein